MNRHSLLRLFIGVFENCSVYEFNGESCSFTDNTARNERKNIQKKKKNGIKKKYNIYIDNNDKQRIGK